MLGHRCKPSPAKEPGSLDCREALEQIRRTPSMPFPDPGAHSWRAYADAVHRAYFQIQQIAARALEQGDGTSMRLTDAECDNAIKALATYEWTGLTRDDVRLIFGTIWNARGAQ